VHQIKKLHQVDKVFVRNITDEELNKRINGWNNAIDATLHYKIKNN
jgi:glycerol kinase